MLKLGDYLEEEPSVLILSSALTSDLDTITFSCHKTLIKTLHIFLLKHGSFTVYTTMTC